MTTGGRAVLFPLPFWGHLSACLAIADGVARRGGQAVFAFVYPPPAWVLHEIAGHGHDCEWSLRYVRGALGAPVVAEQRRDVIAAEAEIIRSTRPDVVLHDCRTTTSVAARACGVPVVSIQRAPAPQPQWTEYWADVQLVPQSPRWLPLAVPAAVYCRPAWVRRLGIASAPLEPRPVLASCCTVESEPAHLRLLLEAFEGLEAEWAVVYPHSDEAAGSPRVVAWADLDVMLAHARVLVCEGGHNLIGRAIMQGVPVVVLETAQRHTPIYGSALEDAGAGILIRRRDQTARVVREAVDRALDDDALRSCAAALRRSTETLPELADALCAVMEARPCA